MPINARNLPELVNWYRGMLLMPEHFRATAARGEMLAPYLLQSAVPFAWGVRTLDIKLEGTAVVIGAIEAVLPDGMVVAIESARGDPPLRYAIDKGEIQPLPGKPVDLYLAVAAWTTSSLDLDQGDSGLPSRYRTDPGPPTPGPPGDYDDIELGHGSWLQPNIELVVGTANRPPRPAYTLLRVARLGLQDGQSALLEYEPPRMRIGDARLLRHRIAELIAEMHARAAHLHADLGVHRTLAGAGEADGTPPAASAGASQDGQIQALIGELRAMRMSSDHQRATRMGSESFRALVRLLPRVRAMLAAGVSHPFDCYLALCDALGELALVSPMLDLEHLPLYRHDDLLDSFDALITNIHQALSVFDLRYRIVPFTRRSDTAFELRLDREDLEAGESLLIGALSPHAKPREEQRRWLETASIGLRDSLADIRRRRVAGWERRVGIASDTALGVRETPQLMLARIVPDPDQRGTGGVLVIESDVGEGPDEINFYRPVPQLGTPPDRRHAP